VCIGADISFFFFKSSSTGNENLHELVRCAESRRSGNTPCKSKSSLVTHVLGANNYLTG
jgi:hypothetical protein